MGLLVDVLILSRLIVGDKCKASLIRCEVEALLECEESLGTNHCAMGAGCSVFGGGNDHST